MEFIITAHELRFSLDEILNLKIGCIKPRDTIARERGASVYSILN